MVKIMTEGMIERVNNRFDDNNREGADIVFT